VSVLFLHYCNDHRLDDSSRKMTQTLDDMDESFHFIICKLKKMVTRYHMEANPIFYDQTITSLITYYFETSYMLQFHTNKLKKKMEI